MRSNSRGVTGQSKVSGIKQPEAGGREHGKQGKDRLQGGLGGWQKQGATHEVGYDVLTGNSAAIFQLAARAERFSGFWPLLPFGRRLWRE